MVVLVRVPVFVTVPVITMGVMVRIGGLGIRRFMVIQRHMHGCEQTQHKG